MYNRTIKKSFFEVLKFCFAINLLDSTDFPHLRGGGQ